MAKVYCEKQTTGLILPRMPKEQFIARMEETIVLRKLVLEFYNKVYLPTLRDFDGKVLNARFIKALNEKAAAKKYADKKLSVQFSYNKTNVVISAQHFGSRYDDVEDMTTEICTDGDGRISYDLTFNHKYREAWVQNFKDGITDCKKSIKYYDKYLAQANKLEADILAWVGNPFKGYEGVPFVFRTECIGQGSYNPPFSHNFLR